MNELAPLVSNTVQLVYYVMPHVRFWNEGSFPSSKAFFCTVRLFYELMFTLGGGNTFILHLGRKKLRVLVELQCSEATSDSKVFS